MASTKAEIQAAFDQQVANNDTLQAEIEDAHAEIIELKEVIEEMSRAGAAPVDEARGLIEHMLQPFEPNQINQLIRGGKDGKPRVYLDYIGHADITHRLLMWDPDVWWEPLDTDENGSPVMHTANGMCQMWWKLHIRGREHPIIEVGSCEAHKKEIFKEIVGDFLRRAAMRLGGGLTLWAKGDREWAQASGEEADGGYSAPEPQPAPAAAPKAVMPAPLSPDPGVETITAQQVNILKALVGQMPQSAKTEVGGLVSTRWGKISSIPASQWQEALAAFNERLPEKGPDTPDEAVQALIDAGLVSKGGQLSPNELALKGHRNYLVGLYNSLGESMTGVANTRLKDLGLLPLSQVPMEKVDTAKDILLELGATAEEPF